MSVVRPVSTVSRNVSLFLAYQYVWPGVITVLLGMKMIYWDCFIGGLWGGENSNKKVGLE